MPIVTLAPAASAVRPYADVNQAFVVHNVVDHSLLANRLAASDVGEVIQVPKGYAVLAMGYTVLRPEGGTAAGTMGDGGTANGYVATVDLNAAAGTMVCNTGAFNLVGARFYASADTLDFTSTQALDFAIVDYWAVMIDCNGPRLQVTGA